MARRYLTLAATIGLSVAGVSHVRIQADVPAKERDKPVAGFALKDAGDQKTVSLADFKDKKAVVVVFTGTECPISNAYLPRLAELHKEYASKGVQFLAVNSNSQDTADVVAAHAKKFEIPFPVLKDDGATVADLLGAKRTPEVVVLDSQRKICYQGRIDDQFGVGYKRGQPTRKDLAVAIAEVLAAKPVAVASTPVAGCLISHNREAKAAGTVTYTKNVATIFQNRCQECHRAGQIGPFSLKTYKQAVAWADTIREVILDRRMPPWYADPNHGKFENDRSLSQTERDTLLAWIDQGCPKGDDKDMPPPKDFPEGWTIGKPDVVFTMPKAFDVPADTPKEGIPYMYFSVDSNFTEDKWIERAEAKGGAADVVHHIVVFIQPAGIKFDQKERGMRILVGTAPGDMPYIASPGTAKKVPAGSKLVFQMHYTPSGKAVKDQSSIGLIFAKQPVKNQALTMPVLNHQINIKPGEDNYHIESSFEFRDDAHILSFMPHMHLRGKDFKYEAIFPDGKTETLLSVPRYNFNWQSSYRCANPIAVPKGTKVHCIAHFDNSAKNPNNPDPTKTVKWGDQTWEEMMIGWMDFHYDRKLE
jgi:peroxiredoxin